MSAFLVTRVLPGFDRAPHQVCERAPDPVTKQQDDHHEDRTQDDVGALEAGRGQPVLERDDDRGAQRATPEGADPTEDRDEHDLARGGPVQLLQ